MLRKLFLLLSGLAAAAVGFVVWTQRDELKGEIERARGERRAGPGTGAGSRPVARSNGSAAASGPRSAGKVNGQPAPGSRSGSPRPVRVAAAAQPRRCAATTQSGSRCTRDAEPGSDRCWQHAE
jgi:hypothetical protein